MILGWSGCLVILCLDANPWHGVCVNPISPAVLYWLRFPLNNFSCRWQRDRDNIDTTFLLLTWEEASVLGSKRLWISPVCLLLKRTYISLDLIRLREPVQASKLLETSYQSFSCSLEYLVCMDFLPQLICLHFMMSFFENVFGFGILVPVILLFPTH